MGSQRKWLLIKQSPKAKMWLRVLCQSKHEGTGWKGLRGWARPVALAVLGQLVRFLS